MVKKDKSTNEVIFGSHSLIELLKAKKRKVEMIYTTRPVPKSWGLIEKLLPKYVPLNYVARDALSKMAGSDDHQGIVAYVRPFEVRKQFFNPKKEPFILLLDGIQDVRNLGAILRSAYCTGLNGVILVSRYGAPLSGAAFKASAGLAEHLSVFVAPSAAHAMNLILEAGYEPYLAVLNGKNALEITYKKPLCLVIGNEAIGISREILSSGTKITLPQRTEDISYNASVAAGILMFTIAHKI